MEKTEGLKGDHPFMRFIGDLKSRIKDAILLFRHGDFYEVYYEDAYTVANICGITLSRHGGNGYYIAGFPHHALDTYLPKIIRAGHRVAICDYPTDPKPPTKRTDFEEETITNEYNTTMTLSINNQNNETKNVQNAAQVINPQAPAAPIEDADAVEIKDDPKAAKYTIQEYTTKKGGTAYLLFGFESKEAAEKVAGKCSKTISASWRHGEGDEKRYCLSLGTRYGDVAKAMCDALNKGDKKAVGKAAKDSCLVYDKAVADGKAAREQAKAEKAAAKQKEDDKPKTDKTYKAADVAAMLKDIMAGKDIPADVKKLMKAA